MHSQAKEAVRRLYNAGFQRKEFSVRTLRYRTKRERAQFGDYGDAPIFFHGVPVRELIERKPAMLENGLSILCLTRWGRPSSLVVSSDGKGTYREIDLETHERRRSYAKTSRT